MKIRLRVVLRVTAVLLVGACALTAAILNPPGTRAWLVACAVAATATAVTAVSSEPRDLVPALLFAMVPVAGLASRGSPHWLGLVLAALLLMAGELNALGWEGPARMAVDGTLFTRLREVGVVAGLGLALAILLGGVARVGLPAETWVVVVGSVGLLGIASIVFPRQSKAPRS